MLKYSFIFAVRICVFPVASFPKCRRGVDPQRRRTKKTQEKVEIADRGKINKCQSQKLLAATISGRIGQLQQTLMEMSERMNNPTTNIFHS